MARVAPAIVACNLMLVAVAARPAPAAAESPRTRTTADVRTLGDHLDRVPVQADAGAADRARGPLEQARRILEGLIDPGRGKLAAVGRRPEALTARLGITVTRQRAAAVSAASALLATVKKLEQVARSRKGDRDWADAARTVKPQLDAVTRSFADLTRAVDACARQARDSLHRYERPMADGQARLLAARRATAELEAERTRLLASWKRGSDEYQRLLAANASAEQLGAQDARMDTIDTDLAECGRSLAAQRAQTSTHRAAIEKAREDAAAVALGAVAWSEE